MKTYSLAAVRAALESLAAASRAGGDVSVAELTLLEDVLSTMQEKGYATIRDDQVSQSTRLVLAGRVSPLDATAEKSG